MIAMRVLLSDLDRTLTGPDLRLERATLERLATLREAGIAVVIVTGRRLGHLEAVGLDRLCAALVAENGAVLRMPSDGPVSMADAEFVFAAKTSLGPLATQFEWGLASGSASRRLAVEVEAALARAGVAHNLAFNAGDVMVLPPGIDKGSGARAALQWLRATPADAWAIGDGENDVPLFRAAARSFAPANAHPEAAAAATDRLSTAYAEAFLEATDTLLVEVRA